MKTIITLDYELSFGKKTGTPQIAMINASNKLLDVLDKYQAKAVFFVDATYLLRLKQLKKEFVSLKTDYDDVVKHIKKLESEGHQVQLHIHPHWLDSNYTQQGWEININRYKLSNWSTEEASDIIKSCVNELNQHLNAPAFAFRAGGWCIQPFTHIKESLIANNIWLDSTVFNNGSSLSKTHAFDFTDSPKKSVWSFNNDPCVEKSNGLFKEIAISSYKVSPLFYWKFALTRKFGNKQLHSSFGDGLGIESGRKDQLKMLTRYSNSIVSIDGYKSKFLNKAYHEAKKAKRSYFVTIGHPKLLTPFSLRNIEKLLILIKSEGGEVCTYPTR